eukprot:GDKI01047140.1.p1 GENE.GDKI01047140.1~~GDKI01047140.1.p1  ORF type:complete len:314 (-),score=67.20 GDKI01047140.1:50-991(-)
MRRHRAVSCLVLLIAVVCFDAAVSARKIYTARGVAYAQSNSMPCVGARDKISNLFPVAMEMAFYKGPEMHIGVEMSVNVNDLISKWGNMARDSNQMMPERDLFAVQHIQEMGMFVNYTCGFDKYDSKTLHWKESVCKETNGDLIKTRDLITRWVTTFTHWHDRFQGAYTHIFESIETTQRFMFPNELLTQILETTEKYIQVLKNTPKNRHNEIEGPAGKFRPVEKHAHIYLKYAFNIPSDTHTTYTEPKWRYAPVGFLGTHSALTNVYVPVKTVTVLLTHDTYEVAEIGYYSDTAPSDKSVIVRFEITHVDRM